MLIGSKGYPVNLNETFIISKLIMWHFDHTFSVSIQPVAWIREKALRIHQQSAARSIYKTKETR